MNGRGSAVYFPEKSVLSLQPTEVAFVIFTTFFTGQTHSVKKITCFAMGLLACFTSIFSRNTNTDTAKKTCFPQRLSADG
jgi:hypothetical protein